MKNWGNLEHQIWQQLQKLGDGARSLTKKSILVAISGGGDSVALAVLLSRIFPKENLALFHYHHGDSENQEHRDQALAFCKDLSQRLGLRFFAAKNRIQGHSSEAEMRQQRYEEIYKIASENLFEVIATGHHQQDLLETRLIRLIRGTGQQGLRAQKIRLKWKPEVDLWRPFLKTDKKDLENYLKNNNQEFLQDPSNQNLSYLRNWIRHFWLPQLERQRSGSIRSMARSLELLSRQAKNLTLGKESTKEGFSRLYYLSLSEQEKQQFLAQFLLQQGGRHYSQSHIEEVMKRLRTSRKQIEFKVASYIWIVTSGNIKIKPVQL